MAHAFEKNLLLKMPVAKRNLAPTCPLKRGDFKRKPDRQKKNTVFQGTNVSLAGEYHRFGTMSVNFHFSALFKSSRPQDKFEAIAKSPSKHAVKVFKNHVFHICKTYYFQNACHESWAKPSILVQYPACRRIYQHCPGQHEKKHDFRAQWIVPLINE